MVDKEDPKLTAYALNEFDENEFSSTDDQMFDGEENHDLVNDIRNESILISQENMLIKNYTEIENLEELFSIKQLLSFCPKKIN